jgi:hypothetical protein
VAPLVFVPIVFRLLETSTRSRLVWGRLLIQRTKLSLLNQYVVVYLSSCILVEEGISKILLSLVMVIFRSLPGTSRQQGNSQNIVSVDVVGDLDGEWSGRG